MAVSQDSPVVVISGASQGIGAAIARCFAGSDRGFQLVLVARNGDALDAVAAGCTGAASVRCYPTDVSDEGGVQALAAKLSRVDVLINNAGSWLGRDVVDMSAADFDAVLAANLRSTFLLTRMVLPGMLIRGSGDIFNMASTAAHEGYAGVSAYCAAKHAVLGFSRALRDELRGKNIRVCTVSPGATRSPSWDNSGVDLSTLMPAEDVARCFLNLYEMDRNVVTEDILLRPGGGHIVSREGE